METRHKLRRRSAALSLLVLFASLAVAREPVQVSGYFVRYQGRDAASSFVPCGSNEAWSIYGGAAHAQLIRAYRSAHKNQNGEVFVTLLLQVTHIESSKASRAHYTATAKAVRVIRVGGSRGCSKP